MSNAVAELESQIRALSSAEKIELTRALIAELDGPADADVEKDWEEAERRYREIADGKVKTVPREQVFENLRSRLHNIGK